MPPLSLPISQRSQASLLARPLSTVSPTGPLRRYITNLRCQACVATIAPALDGHPLIESWHVALDAPEKFLMVRGTVSQDVVAAILSRAGYAIVGEVVDEAPDSPPQGLPNPPVSAGDITPVAPGWLARYAPLLLIVGTIAVVAGLVELAAGQLDTMRLMANSMAGFFIVFSCFKMLDVSAFAEAFAKYDVIASRWRPYGLAYPFIELALGGAYLARVEPKTTAALTLILMVISVVGVARVVGSGQRLQCACLGTVFRLPMSSVTIVENVSMAVMAAAMLIWH